MLEVCMAKLTDYFCKLHGLFKHPSGQVMWEDGMGMYPKFCTQATGDIFPFVEGTIKEHRLKQDCFSDFVAQF